MTGATMAELGRLDPNGLCVASTFAGFGGSSLGYRGAGYKVACAVELDPVAAAVYEANASPTTIVNPDEVGDVCAINGADLRATAGGELDVLDGSPPCQGWSTAGNRDLEGENCRLYNEFVRLVGEARPRAFVAENVTGIRKGRAMPRFLRILAELRAYGYRVAARVLDGSRLGVAQRRERVIVLGFREDQGVDPRDAFGLIRPSAKPTALRHALPGVDRLVREAPPGRAGSYKYRDARSWPRPFPVPTLCANGLDMTPPDWLRVVQTLDGGERRVTVEDAKALSGFPADFNLPEDMTLGRAWEGFGNSVPPPMARAWAEAVRDALLGA